jgi:heme/copper-type cytochrome/quinol oxidase subunit 2
MRVGLLWLGLVISVGLFVVMLRALRNHRAHNTVRTHAKAAVEYGWAIVPWLIVALSKPPRPEIVHFPLLLESGLPLGLNPSCYVS